MAYALTTVIALFIFRQLYTMAQPIYTSNGEISDGGFDLSSPGLAQYMFDVVYITWFVHLFTILSDYFWFFYLVVRILLSLN
jgi:Trk-type K+ transport system membrane component